MTSPSDTSPEEEEGVDVDGAERYRAEQEEEAVESDYLDRNYASLHLTAHMTEKWSEEGKGTEKWRKILVIAEGKMSLSRDAESR